MPVRIEGNVDAGVPHLISNVGGRLAVGDQLAREKVAEVVKPCSRQLGPLNDRPPDVGFKSIWINEPVAVSWEDESGIGVADFEVGEEPHHAVGGRNTAQRLARFWRAEVPLPLANAILAAPFRDGVLDADFIIEPSNVEEPKTQSLTSSHSAESAQVRDRVADAANFPSRP